MPACDSSKSMSEMETCPASSATSARVMRRHGLVQDTGRRQITSRIGAVPITVFSVFQPRKGSRNLGLDQSNHAVYVAGAKFDPKPAGAPARQRASVTPGTFVLVVVE